MRSDHVRIMVSFSIIVSRDIIMLRTCPARCSFLCCSTTSRSSRAAHLAASVTSHPWSCSSSWTLTNHAWRTVWHRVRRHLRMMRPMQRFTPFRCHRPSFRMASISSSRRRARAGLPAAQSRSVAACARSATTLHVSIPSCFLQSISCRRPRAIFAAARLMVCCWTFCCASPSRCRRCWCSASSSKRRARSGSVVTRYQSEK
mmetsp:Transcript_39781/g.86738  ORF Transcript_39781/g.86738 Transcript_39781/m.86738 type:complete len:202 (-) Transcript_39781:32-637(-)